MKNPNISLNLKVDFKRALKVGRHLSTESVWLYTLVFFFLLNILVLTLSAGLFFRIDSGEITSGGEEISGSVNTINRTELDSVIDFFSVREAELENLGVGTARETDLSEEQTDE